jgi:hypothetical protein
MKRIIFLIVLSLIAGNAFGLDFKAVKEAQAVRLKAEQEQQAERARQLEAEQAKKDLQASIMREVSLQERGKGYVLSVEAINALEADIFNRKPVRHFVEEINRCRGATYQQAVMCAGSIEGGLKPYAGSTASLNTASAHIVDGNSVIEIAFGKLLSYEVKTVDGTHETYTWNKDKGIVTYKTTDGGSMMIAKVNMTDPKSTRFTDANLPINAMNTITQFYNKQGMTLSDKKLMTVIKDFYTDEIMTTGKTIQSTMTDLLTEVEFRDQFLKYCKKKAKQVKVETDDDDK